jgi:hypothetical protein
MYPARESAAFLSISDTMATVYATEAKTGLCRNSGAMEPSPHLRKRRFGAIANKPTCLIPRRSGRPGTRRHDITVDKVAGLASNLQIKPLILNYF